MLLKQMRYFVKVVELHSFTEAANECYISQSAISQQVKELEKEIDVVLLHRTNRSFSLTKAGEYFYQHAKEVLDQIDQLKIETKQIDRQKEMPLRIGYPKNYDGHALHKTLLQFAQRYPQLECQMITDNHEELYRLLRTDQIDFALNDQRRVFSDLYVNYHLSYCHCYAEIPIEHPLCKKDSVGLADLKQLPCILIATQTQKQQEIDYYQSVIGIQSDILIGDNLYEARILAATKRGYVLLEGNNEGTLSTLKRIPIDQHGEPIKRNYCAFWKRESTNAYMEELAALLKTEFEKDRKKERVK